MTPIHPSLTIESFRPVHTDAGPGWELVVSHPTLGSIINYADSLDRCIVQANDFLTDEECPR